MRNQWRRLTPWVHSIKILGAFVYSGPSKNLIQVTSIRLISRTNSPVLYAFCTHLDKKCWYFEHLGISKKVFSPMDTLLSLSWTNVEIHGSKANVWMLWLDFCSKFYFLIPNSEDRIMTPVKHALNNKSMDMKCKALKDFENEMPIKDIAAKYSVLRDTALKKRR